jgi:Rps23 Pro-64 3,4-dihydroxylase Tpa1-like proline 4-hydroxylase
VLDTQAVLTRSTEPFELYLAERVLDPETVEALYRTAPTDGYERIEVLDPAHEKQYAMNLRYLQEDDERSRGAADLSPEWSRLLDVLAGEDFRGWLERGTSLPLSGLSTDIGIYTHQDGDCISVHKDKPNKAITAILYLNPVWPENAGGHYEVRESADPLRPPVRTIPPRGGQFLAFPPTDRSWHSVSAVDTGGAVTRLTVQLEFWLEREVRGA